MNESEFNQVRDYILTISRDFWSSAERVIWWDKLQNIDAKEAMAAAKKLAEAKTYGAPKIADFFAALAEVRQTNLPRSLTISAAEALDLYQQKTKLLLVREAASFADRVSPTPSKTSQFRDPEALAEAARIDAATWARDFKARFGMMQSRALTRVAKGAAPQAAILDTLREIGTLELPDHLAEQLPAPVAGMVGAIIKNPEHENNGRRPLENKA